MTDVSRATYIRAPADRPLGIDMKQFEQQSQEPEINAQNKRDLDIINEIMDSHGTLVGVL
jgi:hypothetical protein